MSDQIEGRNPVIEALRSGRPLNKIFMAKDIDKHFAIEEILRLAKKRSIAVEPMAPEALKKMSVTGSAQGVIALASGKGYMEIEDLIDIAKQKNEPAFFVMLDGLEDPHNLGAILRTADAAGVHGVIIPERRSVGLTETVAKVSAGAVEYVPVARVVNLNNAIRTLKEAGIWVIGIEEDGEKDFSSFDLKLPIVLVIGGEGKGISRLVKENCDAVVRIPMKGKISSLNASVAAAVAMYEVLRQRS